MYNLSHITTYVKVVELNNFSAAAKELKLTVAAVSKHVSQLENELGVKLMKRTTRRLMLTEIGHQYYLRCKDILEACRVASSVITQSTDEPSGLLVVKSINYFADRFILPKLKAYQEKYPEVRIELDSAERVPDLANEDCDVFFGRAVQETENIVQKRISSTRFCLCASPEYIEKYGSPKNSRDLVNHKYISHSKRTPTDVIHFGDEEQVYIEPTLLVNDSDAIMSLVKQGMGFSRLQHYIVSDAIQKGELVELLPDYPKSIFPINVFYQPDKYLQTKVHTFVEFILEDLPKSL